MYYRESDFSQERERENKKIIGKCSNYLWCDNEILEGKGTRVKGNIYCEECINSGRFGGKGIVLPIMCICSIYVLYHAFNDYKQMKRRG